MIRDAAFRAILDNTADMVFVKNMNLEYVAASLPFVKMVGKENVEDILGKTDHEIFEDENLATRYVADDRQLLAGDADLINYTEPITDEGGYARYGATSKYILRDDQGAQIGILGITKDITRDYFTRLHYQQELKYLFELPEGTYEVAYVDVDAWRIISQRRQFIEGSTLPLCYTVNELAGQAVQAIKDTECEAAEFYRNFTEAHLQNIYQMGKRYLSFQYERQMADGSVRWVKNEIHFLMDVDTGHLCAMLAARDIDAQKREVEELEVSAKMDRMTMLLNRATVMKQISEELQEHPEGMHALFMVDVDNFKQLNDTLGHMAGDEFLVRLADEIQTCFRGSDLKGRIGGDEFFVFMRNVPNISIIHNRAENLRTGIKKLGEQYAGLPLSGSIGISIYPYHGHTLEDLYAKADTALYEAKRSGKNQFVIAT